MRASLIDEIQSKFDDAKSTFCNFFQNASQKDKQQIHKQKQLDFNEIINQKEQNELLSDLSLKQQSNVQRKIQQAIRNSSIAKALYHKQSPQNLQQKFIDDSEVLKQIQNELSFTIVSKTLDLKVHNHQQENPQLLNGILFKYSPSLFGGWSERYCILTKNKFKYMETKDKNSTVAGIINFNILSFSVFPKYTGPIIESFTYFSYQKRIKVENGQKSFIFKGASRQETEQWFMKINELIKSSQGKTKNETTISNYPRFWRKQYITQRQFEQIAETGDILLFRGKKTSAILQRKMTGQQYDHIGVVLLNAFDQILIFEANGGFGVGICPWKKFLRNKWFEDQQIVAVRHLKIKRTEEFLNDVTKFVENNIGKEYKFSMKNYIMTRNSTVQSEKSSYFCSSLVAKLYKKLGLLDPNVSSSRYMPYDFSDKQKIILLKGKYGEVQLQQQKIIVFERRKNKIFEKPI